MSLTSKSATKTKHAIALRVQKHEAQKQIRAYLEGCLDQDIDFWKLSQDEADWLAVRRGQDHDVLMERLRREGKSAGARYIAARINSGSDLSISDLAKDWSIKKSIRREVPAEWLQEIGASVCELAWLGLRDGWQARRFVELYREVRVRDRKFNSCYQVSKGKVKAIALTPNYNRLPVWVKRAMIGSAQWIETDTNRIGNIWRLVDCAKAWKHAPYLPKGIAEKVGKMSVKMRILADWAWAAACKSMQVYAEHSMRDLHAREWRNGYYDIKFCRADLVEAFWCELKRLSGLSLAVLVAERFAEESVDRPDHNKLRRLSEFVLKLPHGFLFEKWGRHRHASQTHYLSVVAENGSPDLVCRNLFGNSGKRTLDLFRQSSQDCWKWASAVGAQNADTVQKILGMESIIGLQPEAVEFLNSLPVSSRLRLLQATTFKYRGQVCPISPDHIRDTGYLWSHIQQKPALGRVRCWFSAHEMLAAAFVKELPDEALPIPSGWERVDGLCAVDGTWEIELPKRVATLKYWGEALSNCVGGYGPAIKSGRSIVFAVRERGMLTHCVEVSPKYAGVTYAVQQFYAARNSSADCVVRDSVESALIQAGLL